MAQRRILKIGHVVRAFRGTIFLPAPNLTVKADPNPPVPRYFLYDYPCPLIPATMVNSLTRARVAVSATFALVRGGGDKITTPYSKTVRDRKAWEKAFECAQ